MKKSIAICMILSLIFCAFTLTTSAEEVLREHAGYGTTMYLSEEYIEADLPENRTQHCFIRNEYYRVFADTYFESQYEEYCEHYESWADERASIGEMPMTKSADGTVKAVASYAESAGTREGLWYSTVIFRYDSDFSAEKNREMASALSDGMEVLYVGTTTPCAVVAVRGGTQDMKNIIESESVAFVEVAFGQIEPFGINQAIFTDTFAPTAADARKILRYSAKLDSAPEDKCEAKEFFFKSDTNLDGVLTAEDARCALRIAAGLEKGLSFYNPDSGCGAYWDF